MSAHCQSETPGLAPRPDRVLKLHRRHPNTSAEQAQRHSDSRAIYRLHREGTDPCGRGPSARALAASQLPLVPLIFIAALAETPGDVDWSPTFVLVLLTLALPGTAIVYWLWLSVLETLTLNRANAFSFLVPIFGLAVGIALNGEQPTVTITIGASLAFLGIVLVNPTNTSVATPPTPKVARDPTRR